MFKQKPEKEALLFLNHSGCLIFPSFGRVDQSFSAEREPLCSDYWAVVRTHSQAECLARLKRYVALPWLMDADTHIAP